MASQVYSSMAVEFQVFLCPIGMEVGGRCVAAKKVSSGPCSLFSCVWQLSPCSTPVLRVLRSGFSRALWRYVGSAPHFG